MIILFLDKILIQFLHLFLFLSNTPRHVLQALQFKFVKQRLYYGVCIFIYRILDKMLPVSLRNKIEIVSESQGQTRAGNRVRITKDTRNVQKNVFYEKVKMYNSLP